MKYAICYYSMSENTHFAAEKIAQKIKENANNPADVTVDLIRIFPAKSYKDKGIMKFVWGGRSAIMGEAPVLNPYDFDESCYDHIILGSPIWARTFAPPLRTFIRENPAITEKSVSAFFCQSGKGGENAFLKIKEALGIAMLTSELILIDPKEKPSAENDSLIEAFVKKLV